jgi:hypothetical protein
MRVVLAAGAAVALAVLGAGAVAVRNLQAVVADRRGELLARAERTLGRSLTVGGVAPSYWPPGVRLTQVTIGEDPRFGARPFVEAEAVVVAVRPWPLLRGRIETAGVALDGPRIALVRDRRGRWNVASLGAAPRPRGARDRPGRPPRAVRLPATWAVGAALSEIRDGTLEIEDRMGAAPRALLVRRLRVRAEDVRLGARARLRVDAALFAGSRAPDAHLDLRLPGLGERGLAQAPFTARIELREPDLATAAALAGRPERPRGRLGRVTATVRGPLERLDIALEAAFDAAALEAGGRVLVPPLPGRLAVRATRDGDTVRIADGRAALGPLALTATGSWQLARGRLALAVASADGTDLELGLGAPPLRVGGIAARLAIDGTAVRVESARLRLDGAAVALAGRLAGAPRPSLTGRFAVRAFGGSLAGEAAWSAAAGTVSIRGRLAGLDLGAAADRLAPELAGRLAGSAGGSFEVAARVGAGALSDAAGAGLLLLAGARVRGANVAELVLGGMGASPLAPRLVPVRVRARYPEIFEERDTAIEHARIPLELAGGRLAIAGLTAAAAPYELAGGGWIDAARRLRFRGSLALCPSLSARLGDDVPATRHLRADDGRVTVPFRARGPLEDLRVEPDMKALRRRGLELLRAPGRRRDAAPEDAGRRPRGADDLEAAILERLERIIRP